MDNLVETIGFGEKLNSLGINPHELNFELVCSRLFPDQKYKDLLLEIEEDIHRYFSNMQLPEYPTLYGHLLLSLRKQDLVAIFNWDPLLFDSWERLDELFGRAYLPQVVFCTAT